MKYCLHSLSYYVHAIFLSLSLYFFLTLILLTVHTVRCSDCNHANPTLSREAMNKCFVWPSDTLTPPLLSCILHACLGACETHVFIFSILLNSSRPQQHCLGPKPVKKMNECMILLGVSMYVLMFGGFYHLLITRNSPKACVLFKFWFQDWKEITLDVLDHTALKWKWCCFRWDKYKTDAPSLTQQSCHHANSPGTISKGWRPGSSWLAGSSLTWLPCRRIQP